MENISTILHATCKAAATDSTDIRLVFPTKVRRLLVFGRSPYRVVVAVIDLLISKQQRVSDEDENGSQDEGDEQLDVNVIPGAVQFPEETETFTDFAKESDVLFFLA